MHIYKFQKEKNDTTYYKHYQHKTACVCCSHVLSRPSTVPQNGTPKSANTRKYHPSSMPNKTFVFPSIVESRCTYIHDAVVIAWWWWWCPSYRHHDHHPHVQWEALLYCALKSLNAFRITLKSPNKATYMCMIWYNTDSSLTRAGLS